MGKFKKASELKEALKQADKAKAEILKKIEEDKTNAEKELKEIESELCEAKESADYKSVQALTEELSKLKDRLKFYEEYKYKYPVTDEDIIDSWNDIVQPMNKANEKLHKAFTDKLDAAISAYILYAKRISEQLEEFYPFWESISQDGLRDGKHNLYNFIEHKTMGNDLNLYGYFREKNIHDFIGCEKVIDEATPAFEKEN